MSDSKKIQISIPRQCPMCGKVNRKEMEVDASAWNHFCCYNSKPIQEYFPELSASEREFLKTGYCDKCQDILFAPFDEEDDEEEDDDEKKMECMNCDKEHAKQCTETNCLYRKYLEEKGE